MDQKTIDLLNKYKAPVPASSERVYAKLFFYGDHGTWKTTTACQVGMHRGRVLLHTMDDDWKSLKNHPEILQNVDVVYFEDVEQTKLIARALREQVPGFDNYSTFVFDTVGGWVEAFVEEMTQHIRFGKNGRTLLEPLDEHGKNMIKNMGLASPEQTDYNIARLQLRPIMRDLIKAPVNVILNAHSRLVEQGSKEGDNRSAIDYRYVRPDMPEGCFIVSVRKCDALGFFENDGKGESTITFEQGKFVSTKSRVGDLYGKKLKVSDAIKSINEWMGD